MVAIMRHFSVGRTSACAADRTKALRDSNRHNALEPSHRIDVMERRRPRSSLMVAGNRSSKYAATAVHRLGYALRMRLAGRQGFGTIRAECKRGAVLPERR